MTDLVGVASNAVAAYQRALATVSNNIANVATDGYSRQAVVLQANPVNKTGNVFMGTGVMVDRIQRQYDAFAEANLRNSNSDLASQEPMVSYANRVIDVMGGQTMGLTSALDQFFASARDLSADPASTVVRGSFVRDAQGLASRFGQLASQLDLVQEETTQAVSSSVGQMNTIIQQIADVNTQLSSQRTANAQPAALLDQRDQLLKDLSDFAHVNTRFNENGSVLVSLGPSVTKDIVVEGDKAYRIAANFNTAAPEKVSLVLDPYGKPSSLTSISSGSLAGLMAFREQVLGSTRAALDTLASTMVREVNAIHQQGVDGYGQAAGALFSFDPAAASIAGGMQVAFDDPLRVAAAAQFRVIKDANNTGGADATVSYQSEADGGPADLATTLVNNSHPTAGRPVSLSPGLPVAGIATVPVGMQDVSLFIDGADPGQQLQVFTRDGRQVIGKALDKSLQDKVISTEFGFAAGASYSATYLNQSGSAGYKNMNVFYGAKAEVLHSPNYDNQGVPNGYTPVAPSLAGARISAVAARTGVASGALELNSVPLGQLDAGSDASQIAIWLNNAASGVTAQAHNEIVVPANQIKFNQPLSLNGKGIVLPPGGFASLQALAVAVNEKSALSLVAASISRDGQLVLRNAAGYEGQDIEVGPIAGTTLNTLGVTAGLFAGSVTLSRSLSSATDTTPIKFGFGTTGTPADLAAIGFRTGAYISGKVPDDLLVFVTGVGTASVAASYAGTPVDAKQALRAQPMQLKFTTATRYKITDVATGTVLAERDFDPAQLSAGISYQGVHLSFTSAPKSGDTFRVDGDVDGTGNNDNMLALVALERKPLIGSKTLGTAYIDHVNDMGNIARQATIAKAALSVVHEQAVSTHDQVGGVSLDQEAADLIRFQQAYQASAKILQVASQLFDSILQVR